MKKQTIFTVLFLSLVFASCATRTRIMSAPAVSMTESSLPKDAKTTEVGPIESKFCTDSSKDTGTIGLMDEATRNAQKESGADFITNATFYLEGLSCVVISGTAVKKGK